MNNKLLLKLLGEAIRASKMESAGFDFAGSTVVRYTGEGVATSDHMNETEYIKETTRLYRQSWIIGPLEQIVQVLERDKLRATIKRKQRAGDAVGAQAARAALMESYK